MTTPLAGSDHERFAEYLVREYAVFGESPAGVR